MKIEKIIQRDGSLVLCSGYLFGRSRNFDEGRFCDLLKRITQRDNVQFAIVQSDATPVDAVVAQIYEQDAQGLILYTEVPYGGWMLGVNVMLDTHYKADSIAQLTSIDEFRGPDETDPYECEALVKIDEFLQRWNQLEELEDRIKATVNKPDEVVRLLWKAAGITHEYSSSFEEEMYHYVTRRGYEHQELVPYMMRSENWRTEPWYPKSRIC